MLLTAQRVISPTGHGHGVNVYQYLHGPYAWEEVPDAFLPEQNPGELVSQWIELPPGGNRVLSYLDVVVPDEVTNATLQQHLLSLKHLPWPDGNPTSARRGALWARFAHGNLPFPSSTELGALAGHVVLCVSGARGQRAG